MHEVPITLKSVLADWIDIDRAAYGAGVALGLIDPNVSPFGTRAKHVFWSNHSVGTFLVRLLDDLVTLGIVEKRHEPDLQYRWNRGFRGSWE